MVVNKFALVIGCAMLFALCACSRQQSDWQKARETNTPEAYEQFLKKYPSGEFAAQAQAREKELTEERDWQKARDTDTLEGYQAFLKQYPEGKWTEEARIRVENFTLAQTPAERRAGRHGGCADSRACSCARSARARARAPAPAPGSGTTRRRRIIGQLTAFSSAPSNRAPRRPTGAGRTCRRNTRSSLRGCP